ncbi:MAG: galactose oxidase [Candidatus Omnitrophica bacterium]|nr:galactose oxidase [Candidatus Omnitrophota bacterium]
MKKRSQSAPLRLLFTLILNSSLFSGSETLAEIVGVWEDKAPLPTARQEVGVAVLNDLLYVVGGIDSTPAVVDTVERYDPDSKQWETVAPLPADLDHVAVVAAEDRLYAIGGLVFASPQSATNAVFSYQPSTNRWTEESPMPTRRGGGRGAFVGGKIYVAGGIRSGGSVGDFAVFDPVSGEWETLPDMPTPRDHLAVEGWNGKVFAIAGRNPMLRSELEIYDPGTETWTSGADIPTPRAGIASAALLERIFVFGGEGSSRPNGIFDEVEVYNPAVDQWMSLAPMPLGRHGIDAGILRGEIHIPGGGPTIGLSRTDRHDAFKPQIAASIWTLR